MEKDKVLEYLERFVQEHKLEEAINQMKPKYNIGDTVRCVRKINTGAGHAMSCGAGWVLGKEFVVTQITPNINDPIYWPANGGCGVYESALELVPKIIKENKMSTRVFTNSQKIRLRLKTYWENHETEYDDDFEEFYTAFTDAVLDNLEFLAATFKI